MSKPLVQTEHFVHSPFTPGLSSLSVLYKRYEGGMRTQSEAAVSCFLMGEAGEAGEAGNTKHECEPLSDELRLQLCV